MNTRLLHYQNSSPVAAFGVGTTQEEDRLLNLPHPSLPPQNSSTPPPYTSHTPHCILATGPLHMLLLFTPMYLLPFAHLLMPTQLLLPQGSLP